MHVLMPCALLFRAQDAILKDLHTDITKEFEFVVAENHFEVIPGKTEGVYAWIAVNYALDRFSHSTGKGKDISMILCRCFSLLYTLFVKHSIGSENVPM